MRISKGIVFLCVFVVLLLIEQFSPLRQRKHSFPPRFLLNMSMTVIVFLFGSFIVKTAAIKTSEWTSNWHLLPNLMIALPSWCNLVIGILLMDLTFYYWHRANHKIPLLWRFHNVHHIDPDLDVSTSFRFHFFEIFYSTVFRVFQVLILGVAPFTYLIYEILFILGTMFHHSNIRLPLQLERLLNKIIVTPRMHGIHHSAVQEETNSNYSVVFRWWDSLHKTLILNIPQSVINIGIPGYQEKEDNRFWTLLIMPFTKQRTYWNLTDGSSPESNKDEHAKLTEMLQ